MPSRSSSSPMTPTSRSPSSTSAKGRRDLAIARTHSRTGVPTRTTGIGSRDITSPHTGEATTEASARVQLGEIFLVKALNSNQRDGERITHGEGREGRARGGEVVRTDLALHAHIEHHVGLAGEQRVRVADDGNGRHTFALKVRQEAHDLVGAAAIGDEDDGILLGDHPEIAVIGLGRVNEERWRSRAGEGGRDLSTDEARLADAHRG